MEITIPYYEDHKRLSNSSIGVFLNQGIKAFKKMYDGKADKEPKPYFEKGTMVHMYILEPEEFWNNYVILDFDTPSSTQQKAFAKSIANSLELDNDIAVLKAFKDNYSTTNKSDDKMLSEGLEIAQKLDNYIAFLKAENSHKKVISWADFSMLERIKENIKAHKKANKLIYDVELTVESHCEFHINWEFPKKYHDYNMLCKSLIDKIHIDHTLKKITLIDLKTSFDINNFDAHIKEYNYTRQLAYYWLAIHWYFLNELKIEIDDYEKETYIIAIQTTGDNDISVTKFTSKQLEPSVDKISYAVRELSWHFANDKFDFNKDYYEGDGCLIFDDVKYGEAAT